MEGDDKESYITKVYLVEYTRTYKDYKPMLGHVEVQQTIAITIRFYFEPLLYVAIQDLGTMFHSTLITLYWWTKLDMRSIFS